MDFLITFGFLIANIVDTHIRGFIDRELNDVFHFSVHVKRYFRLAVW